MLVINHLQAVRRFSAAHRQPIFPEDYHVLYIVVAIARYSSLSRIINSALENYQDSSAGHKASTERERSRKISFTAARDAITPLAARSEILSFSLSLFSRTGAFRFMISDGNTTTGESLPRLFICAPRRVDSLSLFLFFCSATDDNPRNERRTSVSREKEST